MFDRYIWLNFLLLFSYIFAQESAESNSNDRSYVDSTVYQDVESSQFINISKSGDKVVNLLTKNNRTVISNVNQVPLSNLQLLKSNFNGSSSESVQITTESGVRDSLRRNDSLTLIQIEIFDENVNISNVNIFNVNSTVINTSDRNGQFSQYSTEGPLIDKVKEKYQVKSPNRNNDVSTQNPKEVVIVTPGVESEEEPEEMTTDSIVEDGWNEDVTQYNDEYKTTIIFTNLFSPSDETTKIPQEINLDKPDGEEEKEADKSLSREDQQEEETNEEATINNPIATESDKEDKKERRNQDSDNTKDEPSDIDKELIRISKENALKIERARNQLFNNSSSEVIDNKDGIRQKILNFHIDEERENEATSKQNDKEDSNILKDPLKNSNNYDTKRYEDSGVDGNFSQDDQSLNDSLRKKDPEDGENATSDKFEGIKDGNVRKYPITTVPPRITQRKDLRTLIEEKRRTNIRRIPSFRLNQTKYTRDQPKAANKVIQKLISNMDEKENSFKGQDEDVDTYGLESSMRRSWGGCARVCGEESMTCRFELSLEWFHTMSKACYSCPSNLTHCFRPHCIPADGIKRTIAVINRSLPGPLIQVCEGDTIVAKVTNLMMESTTTIHWHGQHQFLTPYMDGVPSVTQCPIQPGASFTYSFKATQPGTHFYHSHSGVQRGDGAFGGFIVRRSQSKERHKWTYDRDLPEHTIIVLDWTHKLGLQTFTHHHHAGGGNKPDTILVNGRGIVSNYSTPPSSFTVTKGMRYRFRLINAGVLNCPIRISIDHHRLTIIASDGNDIQPYIVDWLVTYAGERWDFVLEANADMANYWIRFIGLMDCDERFTSAHQGAVLHYSGASLALPPGILAYNSSLVSPRLERPPKVLNELNAGMSDGATLVHQLSGLARPQPWLATRQPDRKIVLAYDFNPVDNHLFHKPTMYGFSQVIDFKSKIYTPQLNHISMKLPPFPLLTQSESLTEDMLCSKLNQETCKLSHCECTNIIDIALGDVVEVIFIDQGFVYDANHPFHLHGHSFYVVGMDRLGSNVTTEKVLELDALGQIERNLGTPPLKDTVTVPDGGYTIIRFLANNPGYWMLHCHIDFHVEVGMAVVLRVGEIKDLPPRPIGFPTCGDFEPVAESMNEKREEDQQQNRVESSMVRLIDPTVSPGFGSRWRYNSSSSVPVASSCLYTAVCLLAIYMSS